MTKQPYHLMTPAERLADRIAKNREINQRVSEIPAKPEKAPSKSRKAAVGDDTAIATRRNAVKSKLDEFQKIKNAEGIDAASDFVLSRVKK